MKYNKFHIVEFCPAINQRGDMKPVEDIPSIREAYGEQAMYLSRYLYDRLSHYLGPVLSPFYAEFDDAKDPHRALMELADLTDQFIELGVDEAHIKLRFTGGKGGSIEIPFHYFEAEPSEWLPLIWRKVAEHYKTKRRYKTMDLSVYDRRRLWRMTNTLHKSGRYKIPISLDELKGYPLEEILNLAAAPRVYTWADDRDYSVTPIQELIVLYKNARKAVKAERRKFAKQLTKRAPENFSEERIFPCVTAIINEGVNTENFQRNPTAFRVAVALHNLGADTDYILHQLVEFAINCQPPFPDERYPELEHAIEMAQRHEYTTHCKTPCFEAVCVGRKDCWVFTKDFTPIDETIDVEEFTPETIMAAEELLSDPGILTYIDTEALADVFMERKTKMMLFLLQFSWQSVRVGGITSTGKSHVAKRVMDCFPHHWWLEFTGVSNKFIRHLPKSIRTLFFSEFAAVRVSGEEESAAEYDMKMLMSEGKLTTGTVIKGDKEFTGTIKEVVVNNFITTSTDVDMAPELRNRQWEIGTDSTINLPFVKYRAGEMSKPPWTIKDCEPLRTVLRCAVEIIDRDAPEKWWVPFMDQLVPIFEPLSHRTDIRRNIEKLHKLIVALAKLHYRNRPTIEAPDGTIYGIALPEDFVNAWNYGDEAIMGTLTEMTRHVEQIWDAVCVLADAGKRINSATLSATARTINQDNAKKWLNRFSDMGLISETRRDNAGMNYQRSVETSLGKQEAENSVVIDISSLYSSIFEASTAERFTKLAKASQEKNLSENVVIIYPATVRRFSIEDLPDELRIYGDLSMGAYYADGVHFMAFAEKSARSK